MRASPYAPPSGKMTEEINQRTIFKLKCIFEENRFNKFRGGRGGERMVKAQSLFKNYLKFIIVFGKIQENFWETRRTG